MSNENNGGAIWLKVKLSPTMHKRLKIMAAERGETLQGLVVSILGGPVPTIGKVVDGGGRQGLPVESGNQGLKQNPKTSAYTS